MSGEEEQPKAPGVPVEFVAGTKESWENPGQLKSGNDFTPISRVIRPSSRELNVFSDQRVKTCGSCKHYRQEITQREFKKTNGQWFKELVYDMGWKLRHLPAHPKDLARCGERDDTLVGPTSMACEYHKADR